MKDIDYRLIDINKWEETLDQIKDKKIVVFGAGNNGRELLDILPYKVSYFIDNDREKWNKKLNNISIKNPEILKNEKENVSVLVVGYLYDDMISQLSKFNLEENIHIYNVYSALKHIFDKASFSNRGEDVINFYKRIPDDIVINNGFSKEKISILVSNFSFSSSPFYLITIAIMLKVRGNDVEIIWDDLEGLDELYYNHDNMTSTQNEIIGKVLNYVNERFNIEVIKISEMGLEYLDYNDIRELKKLSKVNTILKYRKVFFDKECEEYREKCFEVLKYNLKKIKYLFNNFKMEKIVTFTGIHEKTGLYTWTAKNYNIQVFSYDASSSDMLLTTEGVATHYKHIEKIIMENKLEYDLSRKFMNFTEENFNKRLISDNNIDSYVYQKAKYEKKNSKYKYDVIIPLNICWDGAALGLDSVFDFIGEWLIETIRYILENTDVKIAVRQHPAERFFNSGEDIKLELKNRFGNNPRFTYISSDDEINTYNLIKSAKLVLPHTSTIGIESVLLGKPVVMATYSYYSNMSFVKKAKSKEEYFFMIKNILNCSSKQLSNTSLEQAKLCYALMMLTSIQTKFTDINMNWWVIKSFEKLLNNKNIKDILSIFESGDPIDIYKTQNKFIN
ncbi:hypothetical protein EXQ37_09665 [Clostridium botulinum]|uniref:capsular polysaccharide export protein, LipB/KpsS family n=1 Tax=Clostridium botulinum TaxID=1491 RepID=UPI001A93282A|nr:hypothetical protein [Clostridium botulinum]MBO0529848.1 hypothetical protein [Clostridium botulinum]MBO0531689.1 hypothetical protein [Clostridium botulinum]MBO0538683.1 hypothetical protein [Clostridium botulinum]MBO0542258.1 hypothetical protein [Clostridium botulinum]MBO0555463.1 hypothetical protein [Clostridium botulinum]